MNVTYKVKCAELPNF